MNPAKGELGNSATYRTLWFYSCSFEDQTQNYKIDQWVGDEDRWAERKDVVLNFVD